jgi:hypothetical protein
MDLTTPLDPSTLSAEARRALTGGSRLMAARGMAPLPNPRDLVSVLYQLSLDGDKRVSEAATRTARELPENVAVGAMRGPDLDPRVLHFFSKLAPRESRLAEVIVLNQSTADETVIAMAAVASDREVELIAANERRLLGCPAIIGALYTNENARASTVTRAIELAIRNQVEVPGIAGWDELRHELLESGRSSDTAEASEESAGDGAGDESDLERLPFKELLQRVAQNPPQVHGLRVPTQIRIAQLGAKQTIFELLRSTKKAVSRAAIKSPKLKDSDAAKIASTTGLSEAVIEEVARRRDWTKLYAVKLALVNNPKCPLPAAARMLPHLREKHLKDLSRSKGIPSALNAQAKKLLSQRGGGRTR